MRLIQYDVGAKAIGWERRNKKPGADTGPREARHRHGQRQLVRHRPRQRRRRRGEASTATAASSASPGAQDIGTGFRTAMAMVVAEELGSRPAT